MLATELTDATEGQSEAAPVAELEDELFEIPPSDGDCFPAAPPSPIHVPAPFPRRKASRGLQQGKRQGSEGQSALLRQLGAGDRIGVRWPSGWKEGTVLECISCLEGSKSVTLFRIRYEEGDRILEDLRKYEVRVLPYEETTAEPVAGPAPERLSGLEAVALLAGDDSEPCDRSESGVVLDEAASILLKAASTGAGNSERGQGAEPRPPAPGELKADPPLAGSKRSRSPEGGGASLSSPLPDGGASDDEQRRVAPERSLEPPDEVLCDVSALFALSQGHPYPSSPPAASAAACRSAAKAERSQLQPLPQPGAGSSPLGGCGGLTAVRFGAAAKAEALQPISQPASLARSLSLPPSLPPLQPPQQQPQAPLPPPPPLPLFDEPVDRPEQVLGARAGAGRQRGPVTDTAGAFIGSAQHSCLADLAGAPFGEGYHAFNAPQHTCAAAAYTPEVRPVFREGSFDPALRAWENAPSFSGAAVGTAGAGGSAAAAELPASRLFASAAPRGDVDPYASATPPEAHDEVSDETLAALGIGRGSIEGAAAAANAISLAAGPHLPPRNSRGTRPPHMVPSLQPWPLQPSPLQPSPLQPAPLQSAPLQPAQLQSAQLQSAQLQPPPHQPAPLQPAPLQPSPLSSSSSLRHMFPAHAGGPSLPVSCPSPGIPTGYSSVSGYQNATAGLSPSAQMQMAYDGCVNKSTGRGMTPRQPVDPFMFAHQGCFAAAAASYATDPAAGALEPINALEAFSSLYDDVSADPTEMARMGHMGQVSTLSASSPVQPRTLPPHLISFLHEPKPMFPELCICIGIGIACAMRICAMLHPSTFIAHTH